MSKALLFTVEGERHCHACARAEFWVVGPDGVAEGVTSADAEGAEDYAETLNRGAAVGIAAERARIREELLAEMEPWTRWDPREFRRALDRICPEEPA